MSGATPVGVMKFRCGDCGDSFEAETEPGEYSWPSCECPADRYQLIGWQEVAQP